MSKFVTCANEYKNIIPFLDNRRKNKDKRKGTEFSDDHSGERLYKRRRPVNSEYKTPRKPSKKNEDDSASRESSNGQYVQSNDRPIIKPVSGTIYDKPRIAPKIKLPVPKNQAEKYAYKPLFSSDSSNAQSTKIYDDYDYEETPERKRPSNQNKKLSLENSTEERIYEKSTVMPTDNTSTSTAKILGPLHEDDDYYEDYQENEEFIATNETLTEFSTESKIPPSSTTIATTTVTTEKTTSRPLTKIITSTTTTTASTSTLKPISSPPTTEIYIARLNEPLIRLLKRPFLPSRGGNPFSPRGLQPVGARALNSSLQPATQHFEDNKGYSRGPEMSVNPIESNQSLLKPQEGNQGTFKSPPQILQSSPISTTQNQYYYSHVNPNDQQRANYIQMVPVRNPIENEYDATVVNESRQPVSNIPVRFPTSGLNSPDLYSTIKETMFAQNTNLAPVSYNVYQNTPQRQTYQVLPQTLPRTDLREHFVHSSSDFNRQQYSVINENDRPRQVKRTQAYFQSY